MIKHVISIVLLVVVVLLLGVEIAIAQENGNGSIVARIEERGQLICGVRSDLLGFGAKNEAGEYVGFDIDFCKAVAIAILGDPNAVEYVDLGLAERQDAISSNKVDMISRTTTWTLGRDTEWNVTFGPTTFYDGQGIMVKVKFGVTTIEELGAESIMICTNAFATTETNIANLRDKIDADWELNLFEDFDDVMDAYEADACDAIATDMSGLLSRKASSADPSSHYILPGTISKEPLGPLSSQDDPHFADIIRWTVWGLITAEELGITSSNIDDFMDSEDINVQYLLGLGDQTSGNYLGINNQFMVDVIRQVGNYSEIFDRNLGPDTIFGLPRGVNALWIDGGLLYAPPFK